MKTYTFASYHKDAPLPEQISNVVFVMLRQAVMQSQVTADKPTDRAEWRRVIKVMDALEPLELKEGKGEKETIRLIEQGGTLALEDAEDESLWKLVDAWLKHVPLSAARQVNWLLDFKDSQHVGGRHEVPGSEGSAERR